MTNAEKRAREILSNEQLADLLDEWELTINNKSPEIYMVRGWLMDELESRNPEGFEKWLDSDADDAALRDYITK